MNEGERVKFLRKELKLTLENFGSKVGIGKSGISKIERCENNLSEQMIASICNANWDGRRVSETWLRTGEGEPFLPDPEDDIARFAKDHGLPDGVDVILRMLSRLPEEYRKAASRHIVETCTMIAEEYGETKEMLPVEKQAPGTDEKTIDEKVEAYRKALEEEAAAKARLQVS